MLKNLSLNRKLGFTFAGLILIFLAVSGIVLFKANLSVEASTRQSASQRLIVLIDDAMQGMLEQAVNQRGFLLLRSDSTYGDVAVNRERMVKAIAEAKATATDQPELSKQLDAMQAAADVWYNELARPQIEAARTTDKPLAEIIEIGRNLSKGQLDTFRSVAAKIKADAAAWSELQTAEQTASIGDVRLTLMVGGLAAALVAAALAWALSRGIVRPIVDMTGAMGRLADGDHEIAVPALDRTDEVGRMAQAVLVFKQAALENLKITGEADKMRSDAETSRRLSDTEKARERDAMLQATSSLGNGLKRLASGDLGFQLNEPFAGDFESLRQDFNRSVAQLAETLAAVSNAAGSIDSGTREISQSSDDLSRRTEQQAASLEETAAALDQITVNVSNSSKRADEARDVAVQANASAAQSGSVVANAVEAMRRIEESSSQISNIIGVIDEIAFQTNLLALNAGVEAARAGDAGKGFAVVAQEVRELAQRSAKAAKEIKDLIRNSSVEVEGGVKLVRETGDALKTIETYVVTINQHMDAIATSAREQSVGLAEVNTAVNQMDQVTQQNAAMVEETNAASATLANEASRLRELISQFQLDTGKGYSQSVSRVSRRAA